ncbi:MAG: ATP-binding cassette domain-containing protein [Anaerolineaceae bacterium]|nr:ATP-binding cassette domain-containing protein [Anaerolineaceae bacterium]
MNENIVCVEGLTKTFRVPVREEGLGSAVKSLFQRRYEDVHAVRSVEFSIRAGEMVAFIGPNGAGKTTTLKMLAGLLHPTSGQAQVAGYVPWERRSDFLRRISMVLGNKSQMMWDIPPLDTFSVLAEIYHLPPAEFRRSLDELVSLLDLGDLLKRPVRTFSLGERMKCELVAGLLHRPAVLFLDEPTLGLDVQMQGRLRQFVAEYNRRHGSTVILTSHYMADVVALCPRVLLIHHGQLLYDGALNRLAEQLAPFKLLRLSLVDGTADARPQLPGQVEWLGEEDGRLTLRVPRREAPALTTHLLNHYPVSDLSVEDPPIEAVIDRIYQEGAL